MDKNRNHRIKLLSLAVLGLLAVGAVIRVEAKPEARFAGCEDDRCEVLLSEPRWERVKRQESEPNPTTTESSTDPPTTTEAASLPVTSGGTDSTDASGNPEATGKPEAGGDKMPLPGGDVPLPPPQQTFPNLPKNFPYPTLDVVQSPPVPTRPRKRPAIKSPYPGAPMTNPMFPVATPPAAVKAPEISPESLSGGPDFFDVSVSAKKPHTDYDTYGPVDPGFSKTTDAAIKEETPVPAPAPVPAPIITPVVAPTEAPVVYPDPYTPSVTKQTSVPRVPAVPQVPQKQAATGAAAAYAFAPEDWRFSVTPRAHRKCKPTGAKTSCRKQQPQTQQAIDYDYAAAAAPAVAPKAPACRKLGQAQAPAQAMEYDYAALAAAAAAAGRGAGVDPSMVNAAPMPNLAAMPNAVAMQPAVVTQPGAVDPWLVAKQQTAADEVALQKAVSEMGPAQAREEAGGAAEKPDGGKGGASAVTASVVLLLANVLYMLM